MQSAWRYSLYVLGFVTVSIVAHVVGMALLETMMMRIIARVPIFIPYSGLTMAYNAILVPSDKWHWHILTTLPITIIFLIQALFLQFQLRHTLHLQRWIGHCIGVWAFAVLIVVIRVESARNNWIFPPAEILLATCTNLLALLGAYYLEKFHRVSLLLALFITLPISYFFYSFVLPEPYLGYTSSFWGANISFAVGIGALFGVLVLLTYPIRTEKRPKRKNETPTLR